VKILSFDRPFRRDHRLDADTRRPTGMDLALRKIHAKHRGRQLVIGLGEAAGAVEQELVEGKAAAAANRAEIVYLVVDRD
jgi:hypothetical protein